MMIQIIAAVIATVGFSVLFGVPSKYYPYCGVIGGAGWLVYLLTLEHFSTAGCIPGGHYGGHFLIQIGSSAEKVSGDHFPDCRDISTGTGRRCVLDSLLHCDRPAAAGGRDRLHGSEGGGGYRAGNCVYI